MRDWMMTIDSLLAQIEQSQRTAGWFGPERRSYYLDIARGPDWWAGCKVVEVAHLAQTKTIGRSWRERLFSRPWQPWRKLKTVPTGEPVVYADGRGTIYAYPRGVEAIRQATAPKIPPYVLPGSLGIER